MLVSAAVCPHPPALVPAVSGAGSALVDDVRAACLLAVRSAVGVPHDLLVCVGAWPRPVMQRWGPTAGGTLRGFGVDVRFGGAQLVLPPALTVAMYLLEEAAAAADILQAVPHDAAALACRDLGIELADADRRVAMLVMGDGSAKRTRQSPGYYDAGAEAFDREALRALSDPDPDALLNIDPVLAEELWAAGRPAWQVLAGALASSGAMTGTVRYDGAPLGVGYLVVELQARRP